MKKLLTCIISVALAVVMTFSFAGCFDTQTDDMPTDTTPKEYLVQYVDDSGIHKLTVTEGLLYSLEEIPQKTGYSFTGLFDAEVGGVQHVSASGTSLAPFTAGKNLVLFPQFKLNNYTVVLDYQGAPVMGDRQLTVSYDESLPELPRNVITAEKKFEGWYTKPNCEGVQVADEYGLIPLVSVINEKNFDLNGEAVYLYAGFSVQKFEVTFYFGNGLESEKIEAEYGTPVKDIVPKTRVDGKVPISWSQTYGGKPFTGKIESTMNLYALEYAPVIDFDTDGGNEINPLVARAGSTVSLPSPIKENYKFIDWRTEAGKSYNSKIMPSESMTLVANWQAIIVFDTNGGNKVNNISEPTGTKIELPKTEKEGYIFAGWYIGDKKVDIKIMPQESIVLTARYGKIQTDKITIISASATRECYKKEPSFIAGTYDEVDLSEIYNKGVRNIRITAYYCALRTYSAFALGTQYTYMKWYNEPTASSANEVWSYSDVHETKDKYASFEQTTEVELTGPELYVCYYTSAKDGRAKWTDFYIEVEYLDMKTLY